MAASSRVAIYSAAALLIALACRRLIQPASSPTKPRTPPKRAPLDHLFTRGELALHGNDAERLLLSILGTVYDVSTGREHYAKGQGYDHFPGRDASKAFISGDSDADLTDDLSSIDDDSQLLAVVNWRKFYEQHETYTREGRLAGGAYYDAEGEPTEALAHVLKRAARAERAKARVEQRRAAMRAPRCSSRVADGLRSVWCTEAGLVPRDLPMDGSPPRCVCVMADEAAASAVLVEIAGCAPNADRCMHQPWPPRDREPASAASTSEPQIR
jgi:hypothetical protein